MWQGWCALIKRSVPIVPIKRSAPIASIKRSAPIDPIKRSSDLEIAISIICKMSDSEPIAHSIYAHLISSLFGAHGVHLLFDAALLAKFTLQVVEILLYKYIGLAE